MRLTLSEFILKVTESTVGKPTHQQFKQAGFLKNYSVPVREKNTQYDKASRGYDKIQKLMERVA